jgi:hypothetical protein
MRRYSWRFDWVVRGQFLRFKQAQLTRKMRSRTVQEAPNILEYRRYSGEMAGDEAKRFDLAIRKQLTRVSSLDWMDGADAFAIHYKDGEATLHAFPDPNSPDFTDFMWECAYGKKWSPTDM